MLLLDDEAVLPVSPDDAEKALASALGIDALNKIDEAIMGSARSNWLKVARVIADAISAGGFAYSDAVVNLHARRVIALVASGALESQGNLNKPRFSEVCVPNGN